MPETVFAWQLAGLSPRQDGERLMSAVSIQEIESVLAAFPGLASVTVVEHGTAPDDQYLIAYVTPAGTGLDVPALHSHARRFLPAERTLAAIVVLDELPVTADGTVDLAALPEPDLEGLLPYRAPATPRQEALCALFAEALGVVRCGVDNDFFKLGGRSVDATLLAARISTELGVRIAMADLFRAPTPGDLDRRVSAREAGAAK
jgi:hypothetical protein